MIFYITIILTSIVSSMLTFYVSEHHQQGAVRSSAMLSLVVGLICYFLKGKFDDIYIKNIPVAFIGASFVGMVSSKALSHIRLVGFAGFVFSLIYLNASKFFTGYGGALGTSASIAIMVTMCIPIFIPRRKTLNGFIILRNWVYRGNYNKYKYKQKRKKKINSKEK